MSSKSEFNQFTKTLDNLKVIIEQLKDENVERSSQSTFAVDLFWKNLSDASTALSHEVTKISLSFSKAPYPKGTSLESLFTSLEMSCLCFISVFYGYPKSQGITVGKQLRKAVIDTIDSIHQFVSDVNNIVENRSNKIAQSTGTVWEAISKLTKLPKDNKEAVMKILQSNSELINDAMIELEDEINNSGDPDNDQKENEDIDDGVWSNSELEIAKISLGLIKTANACTRKTCSVISKSDNKYVSEFDDIFSKIEALSSLVDDFVGSLYPTVSKEIIKENATLLSNHLKALLSTITDSKISNSDQAWIEFLMKAIDHNMSKVTTATAETV